MAYRGVQAIHPADRGGGSVAQAMQYGVGQQPTPEYSNNRRQDGGAGADGAGRAAAYGGAQPGAPGQAAGRPVARSGDTVWPAGSAAAARRMDVVNPYRGGSLGAAAGSYGLPVSMAPIVAPPRVGNFPSAGGDGIGLEARVAALERSLAQHDSELHGVKQEISVGRSAARVLGTVDDQLRSISGIQEATVKRTRQLEEIIGASEGRGQPHSDRLRQLASDLEVSLNEQRKLETRVAAMAAESRRDLTAMVDSSVQDMEQKLSERVQRWGDSTGEQFGKVSMELKQMEDSIKEQVAMTASDLGGRLQQLETHVVPSIERSLREENAEMQRQLRNNVTQLSADIKGAVELSGAGDEQLRKDHKELQTMAQKGLLSLKSEAATQSETVARLLKEEISTRMLSLETVNSNVDELRQRLDTEIQTVEEAISNVQAELAEQIDLANTSIEGVDQSVGEVRVALDQTAESLRNEISAETEVAQGHGRKLQELEVTLQRGLKQTFDRISGEQSQREESLVQVEAAAAQMDEAVQGLYVEMRAVIAKTDIRMKTEANDREVVVDELRQDIKDAAAQAARDRAAIAAVQSKALVDAEGRLDTAIDEAQAAVRSEVDAAKTDFDLQMQNLNDDLSNETIRVDNDMNRRLTEVVDGAVEDFARKLTTLQDETSATLVGFREHMDNEFETEANHRDELRGELKSIMDGNVQDGKAELEFAINRCQEGTLVNFREEITTTASKLEGELRKLHEQTQQAIDVLDDRLVECGKIMPEVDVLRTRFTAMDESLARLNHQLRASFSDAANAQEQDARSTDERFAALQELIDTQEVRDADSAAKIETLLGQEAELREKLAATDARTDEGVVVHAQAEQAQRVTLMRMEERNVRIAARLTQQEAGIHAVRSVLDEHSEALPSMEKRLVESIATYARKLDDGITVNRRAIEKHDMVIAEETKQTGLKISNMGRELELHVQTTESNNDKLSRMIQTADQSLRTLIASTRQTTETAMAETRTEARAGQDALREELESGVATIFVELNNNKADLESKISASNNATNAVQRDLEALTAQTETSFSDTRGLIKQVEDAGQNATAALAENVNLLTAAHEEHVQSMTEANGKTSNALEQLESAIKANKQEHEEAIATNKEELSTQITPTEEALNAALDIAKGEADVNLTQAKSTLEEARDHLLERLTQLEATTAKAEEVSASLDASKATVDSILGQLEGIFSTLETSATEAAANWETTKASIEELGTEIQEKLATSEASTKTSLDALSSELDTKLKAGSEASKAALEEFGTWKSTAEQELAGLKLNFDTMEADVDAAVTDGAVAESKVGMAIGALRHDVERVDKAVAGMTAGGENKSAEISTQLSKLTEQVSAAEDQLKGTEKDLTTLKDEMATFTANFGPRALVTGADFNVDERLTAIEAQTKESKAELRSLEEKVDNLATHKPAAPAPVPAAPLAAAEPPAEADP